MLFVTFIIVNSFLGAIGDEPLGPFLAVDDHDPFSLVVKKIPANNKGCDAETQLFVGIISHPSEFQFRSVIRDTWSVYRDCQHTRLIFLIGKSDDQNIDVQIEQEVSQHQDILLFDYIESYSRVPRKIFGFLHYIEQHCPNIKCVVKGDSDTVINLRGVEKLCESASAENHTITGYYGNLKPVRDIKSKWFTPYSVYPKKLWPDFATGFTYIFSGEGIIPRLMEAIRMKTTFFTSENTRRIFEDVFFTGIAREAAGIQSPVKNWGFHWGNKFCNKPGVINFNENKIGYWKHEGKKYLLAMESRSECQSNCTIEYGWEKFIQVNQNENFPNTSKCSREMFSLRNFTAVLS